MVETKFMGIILCILSKICYKERLKVLTILNVIGNMELEADLTRAL